MSETRLIVAVDMDDVLCQYLEFFLRWHNRVYETSLIFSDVKDFDLSIPLNISKKEMYDRIDEFSRSEDYLSIEPIDGAYQGLMELEKMIINPDCRVIDWYIVTARRSSCRDATVAWLQKNFPALELTQSLSRGDSVSRIVFCDGKKKSTICAEIGASILVDDSISNISDCSGLKRTILFNYKGGNGWSAEQRFSLDQENLIFCTSWPQVLSEIF